MQYAIGLITFFLAVYSIYWFFRYRKEQKLESQKDRDDIKKVIRKIKNIASKMEEIKDLLEHRDNTVETRVELENIIKLKQELMLGIWNIGQSIVRYEKKSALPYEEKDRVYRRLSNNLKKYGKLFSKKNIEKMKLFSLKYSKPLPKLTWGHLILLLDIKDDTTRLVYTKKAEKNTWSVRELKEQIERKNGVKS